MYSCLKMIQPLRSASRIGFSAHPVDKDLFQRRFHHLEAQDARALGRRLEQVLRIGAGTELELGIIAVVVTRLDQRAVREEAAVALVFDLYEAPPVSGLDLAQTALKNRASVID